MRRFVIFLTSALLALVAAAPAGATVSPGSAGGIQVFLDSDDAGDTMSLSCVGGQVRYLALDILPCAITEAIFITGNGGNDTVDLSAISPADFPVLRRVLIDGGSGFDDITGSQVDDTIEGDSQDTIVSLAGDDEITGGQQVSAGPGNDRVLEPSGNADGGPGDDYFENAGVGFVGGGEGFDTWDFDFGPLIGIEGTDAALIVDNTSLSIAYEGVPAGGLPWSFIERVQLGLWDGGTQSVDGSAYSGTLEILGRSGTDILIGGSGEDFLFGGDGDDQLTGGPNFDYLSGDAGADTLQLRDGEIDRGNCGADADAVVADAVDSLAACESADLPIPPDTVAPSTSRVRGPGKVAKGKIATFRFSSSEPGGTFRCKIDRQRFRSCKSPLKVRTNRLAARKKHTLRVVAVDAAGNADPTPATRKFTVTPAKKKRAKKR